MRVDDYIVAPKSSGYRGIHLIYRYYSDRNDTYNGLQVEVQLRSALQHSWATAVETVGTFLKQSLKASQGHEAWLRFFALMGSILAVREHSPEVPGTPVNAVRLVDELRDSADSLDVENRLRAYGAALQTLEEGSTGNAHFFLMALVPTEERVTIRGFQRQELERAAKEYMEVEKSLSNFPGAEAVLVSVESIAALKRAYPNYFLDTRAFLSALQLALA